MSEAAGGDAWMLEALTALDTAARRCNFSYAETTRLRLLLVQICRLDDDAHEIIPVSAFLRNIFTAGQFDVVNLEAIDQLVPGTEQALRDHVGIKGDDAFRLAITRGEIRANPDNVLATFTAVLNKGLAHAAG